MRKTDEPRRIALLMPRANVHTRGIFRGVTRFARPFRAWSFFPALPGEASLRQLKRWDVHGVIATVPDAALERRLAASGLPLVNCSSNVEGPGVNRVLTDNAAVGRLSAQYFLDRGYRHLAFCGERGSLASRRRMDAFCATAKSQGVECVVFQGGNRQMLFDEAGWKVSSGDVALRKWVRALPRPTGVLACHDAMAMLVGDVGRELGVEVPAELAILGVDNDVMLCEMAYPSLSSVQTAQEAIGFEAARRMDALLADPGSEPTVLSIEPVRVVTRQSTDTYASSDGLIVAAMRYIHEHADQPIRVDDVVARVGVSRRSLELRFRRSTGGSILAAIQRSHVALADELLATGRLRLEALAEACGFNSRERFSRVYKSVTGRTPRSAYPQTSNTAE